VITYVAANPAGIREEPMAPEGVGADCQILTRVDDDGTANHTVTLAGAAGNDCPPWLRSVADQVTAAHMMLAATFEAEHDPAASEGLDSGAADKAGSYQPNRGTDG
jgi:hypothetical protein